MQRKKQLTNIKIPVDPGPAGWEAILPSRKPFAELTQDIEADYLVIGAGFAGLSAARRLVQLQPDAQIVVLEGKKVAEGPAGRNTGFMIDLPHDLASDDYAGSADNDRRQTAMNRAAIDFARQTAEEYNMPSEAFNPCGKTNAAATAKGLNHNADYARHLDLLDEPYQLLDAKDMREKTGINYYQGGLWTPGTAMLQPALYIRELASGLQKKESLELFESSPVIRLKQKGHKWLASTPKGSVLAGKVILAVNGLVERFGYFQKRLMHVFTYASMTRALSPFECKALGGEANCAFTPADPMGSTVRRISGIGGDRLIVRNRFTYDPSMEVSGSCLSSVAETHIEAFHARFPILNRVEMEYCWGGRLCLSLNNVFALGEVEEGVYSACCQNGLGTAKGTIAGIIAAEQATATEVESSLIKDYQAEPAPQKLWPIPMMWLGANGYMRLKEWRAGKEF